MKLSLLALPALLAGASASTEELRARRRLNKDFLQAMHSNPKIASAQKKGREEKIRDLHENLMKASRKLEQNQNKYADYEQQAYQDQQNYYDNAAQWQQGDQQGQYNEEGQAYSDVGTWNGQYWEFEGEVPFDLTSRAFKYSGCAAIKTYDVDRAYENGNPMSIDTFAVFRLCPADKCNKYSMTGCGKNYGEYAVEIKTYLTYILGFYDERYNQYCDYCGACDYSYEAKAKSTLQQCYANLEQAQYENSQQAQQQAWQDYYDANNGDMSGWNVNGQNGSGQGDQNFQNYNNYYNNAHSGSGAYYSGSANVNGGAYGQAQNSGSYGGYGNRKLEQAADDAAANGYFDQDGNWVANDQQDADANANGYVDQDGNWVAYDQQDAQQGAYYDGAAQGYWGADGVWYEYAAQYEGDQGYQQYQSQFQQYKCKDGSSCDYCVYQNEQVYATCDSYVCGDYYSYCSDLYGQQNQFDVSEFLECAPYETQYGDIFYLGPHCGSDHYTISLGIFKDENCLEYVGEDISLSEVLGFQHDDEELFKLPKECISCDGAEDYAEQQEASYQEYHETQNEQDAGNQYYAISSPETDQDGVVAVCRALYAGSAQCNMHMNNFNTISRYMSQYELDIEKRTCSFIENIIGGAYDESGEIMLTSEEFDFKDWRNPKQLKRLRMPAGQAVLLSVSIIAFVAAVAVAAFTQRSLRRGRKGGDPWKEQGLSPAELSKTSSGIVVARSRSGPGSAPLI